MLKRSSKSKGGQYPTAFKLKAIKQASACLQLKQRSTCRRNAKVMLMRTGLLRHLLLVGLLTLRPGALDVGQNCFNLFVT